MENALDTIYKLKERGTSINLILAELKNKNVDPIACFRLMRIVYEDQEIDILNAIGQIYGVNIKEIDWNNPFTDDFINSTE